MPSKVLVLTHWPWRPEKSSISRNSWTPERPVCARLSVTRGPYVHAPAAISSRPVTFSSVGARQTPKTEPTAKFESTTDAPSSGSIATE